MIRELMIQHFSVLSSSKVGATIADDIKAASLEAALLSLAAIFLYILIRFRKWQFSTGAIVSLAHDTAFVFAAFAIARVFGVPFEIEQVFVAAVLTVIGYSINDTVIIFDRIREYSSLGTSHDMPKIFNSAINSTLNRTLITSGTTLLVVVALLLLGGEVLRGFSFALFVGIGIGTYSSIFIAAPIVLDLKGKDKEALNEPVSAGTVSQKPKANSAYIKIANQKSTLMEIVIVIVFIIGYVLIALEHPIKINKTATALLTGVLCWALFVVSDPPASLLQSEHYASFVRDLGLNGHGGPTLSSSQVHTEYVVESLGHHLNEIAQILFFLMGAMTIVELVDAHHGFRFITDRINTKNPKKLLWIVCWVTFFLSAVLDNLTTTIVMVSLIRKLIPNKQMRLFFAGMIIIAANAGGAWSPIGDVTTTMLWIGGQISSFGIIKATLVPKHCVHVYPSDLSQFYIERRPRFP